MQQLNWHLQWKFIKIQSMELCALLKKASFIDVKVVKMFQHYTVLVNMLLAFHTVGTYPTNGTSWLPFLNLREKQIQ